MEPIGPVLCRTCQHAKPRPDRTLGLTIYRCQLAATDPRMPAWVIDERTFCVGFARFT